MSETMFYLKQNKIEIDKLKYIDKTDFIYDKNNKNLRDAEIIKYLIQHNESKNYLVIDDEAASFKIPAKNKIVTNIYNDALDTKKAKHWLNAFNNNINIL